MDSLIVASQEQAVVVGDTANSTVVAEVDNSFVVVTGIMGPPGAASISQADDLDVTELADGAVLVYQLNTQKWKATKRLDNQILEAGQF